VLGLMQDRPLPISSLIEHAFGDLVLKLRPNLTTVEQMVAKWLL
jgi:hypothetical protein